MGVGSYRSSVVSSKQETIKLEGVDLTEKLLKKLGASDAEIQKATIKSAKKVLVDAKSRANFRYAGKYQKRTGRLLDSLKVVSRRNHASIRGGGAKVPYANAIHWGWFYDKKNFVYKNIKPNPFLSRALGYNREEIIKDYERVMNDLLNQYAPPITRRRN